MLSILIPIYNFKVEKLVAAVMRQCQKENIVFEVLCYDDNSSVKYRQKNNFLTSVFKVNYLELKENLGRAKIRNWLAKSARYDLLLFLDCDSKIVRKDFIKKYLANAKRAKVISGGRVYSKKAPKAKSKLLHWKYGTRRESRKASHRSKEPINFFHSNNFLINRSTAMENLFDEEFMGYGYEDIFFAKELSKKGIKILHIDNPVEHLGLEKHEQFIAKNLNAVKSLAFFENKGERIQIRLQRVYESLKDWKLLNAVLKLYEGREEKIKNNLRGNKPNLLYFDLLRLYHYHNYLENPE